jgi:nucleotide-binding universal stress UspA family protein
VYANILVAVDIEHRETMERALRAAKGIAADSGARLHLVTVIPAAPVIVDQYLENGYEKLVAKDLESDLMALLEGLGLDPGEITRHVRFGVVYREILAQAERCAADLLVVGAHESAGLHDFLIGSNAVRVVQHASCSVLVVR